MRNSHFIPTVYLSGGLGNQLFQIASGLQFKTKKLLVNTSQVNGKFELTEFLQFLAHKNGLQIIEDSTSPKFLFRKAHNFLLRSTRWRGEFDLKNFIVKLLGRIIHSLWTLTLRDLYTDQDSCNEFSPKNSEFDVIGYFQTAKVAEAIREYLNEYLDSHYIVEKYKLEKSFENELMLHVRGGDYVSENRIGMLSLHYFNDVLARILKTYSISKLNFFSNSHINPTDFNFLSTIGDFSQPRSHSTIDLLARMRVGKLFVISNSTLSWWAAFLSTNSEKQVFAPIPWFRDLSEPVNLIPSDWTRVPAIWSQGNDR
jgi:hypothetical protein